MFPMSTSDKMGERVRSKCVFELPLLGEFDPELEAYDAAVEEMVGDPVKMMAELAKLPRDEFINKFR